MKRFARGFVYLKTKPAREKEVMEKILELEEVREAHIIAGEWDILAVVRIERDIIAPSEASVLDFTIEKIAKISHIVDTSTVIPEFSQTKFKDGG